MSNAKRKIWQCQERYKVKGVEGCTNVNIDENVIEKACQKAFQIIMTHKEDYIIKWQTLAEFGNPLEQYRAAELAEITEETEHINRFDADFMLKVLDHIAVFGNGKLVITFIDGTEMVCGGE